MRFGDLLLQGVAGLAALGSLVLVGLITWKVIEGAPKPLKWRLRAQVGDRIRWYELPEETRSPYQPE